ncbi:hypothetical protein L9F63_007239 [Diploptera punctata]|uniref:Essential for reactive oxygen species protein n=1 Tax=Diploptera punctata TaxID=6984 RepID=A0AAD7Z981_DIPPU|nr:hypothetical protein L9F63_007239 [Diploptera punctata]
MGGPVLKFKNEEKLHISKGPGIRSWTTLIGLLIIGLGSAIYLADSTVTKTAFILMCLVLGLICMDEWEDCVMDRYQAQVTLTKSNWYDRLCCRYIIGVQSVRQDGLYFMLITGSFAPITTHPIKYSSINH